MLLEISCDVIVQGWWELQDLKSDIITANGEMELWLMREQTNIIIEMTNPNLVFNSEIIVVKYQTEYVSVLYIVRLENLSLN